jgi:hypothetical protein
MTLDSPFPLLDGRSSVCKVWSVPEAIEYMKHLVEFKPIFIEGLWS